LQDEDQIPERKHEGDEVKGKTNQIAAARERKCQGNATRMGEGATAAYLIAL